MSYRGNGRGGGRGLMLLVLLVIIGVVVYLLNQPTQTTFRTIELLFFR
ncbi:MAG TPA: hypothetical protein VD886_06850 [Herpetosiphonaceae bacterium]|nr:hypothetical protein [Herpetosiphonaceae bacterium]